MIQARVHAYKMDAAGSDASFLVPTMVTLDDPLCDALCESLARHKAADHEIIKLSISTIDGCEQCDKAAIERSYHVIRGVLQHTEFRVPTTSQMAMAFARVDTRSEWVLSGHSTSRARWQWATAEAERLHFILSYVCTLCKRAKTSRSMKINQLKQLHREILAKQPTVVAQPTPGTEATLVQQEPSSEAALNLMAPPVAQDAAPCNEATLVQQATLV